MATSKSKLPTDTTAAVDAFMATLQHPHKAAIEALRKVVRDTDSSISEGIKWNAPSFRTTEYFATTHLRAKSGLGLILHLGAKARDIENVPIEDPEKLLNWLAKDRAMVSFDGLGQVEERTVALQRILRQWIRFV